MARTVIRR